MEILEQLKDVTFWNNTGYDYFLALVVFIGLVFILKIFQVIILARLHKLALKTQTDIDDMLIEVFKKIKPPFYFFVAIYFSIKLLNVSDLFNKVLLVLFLIAIVFEIVHAIERVLDFIIRRYLEKTQEEGEDNQHSESMINLLKIIVKIILWVMGLLLILSNLGINITSLVAGMGIGGIAIALALQNVLSDLFSAFSIYIDKPFKVGDHIKIGTDRGVVEKIGMKSTRVRTLQGEQLIVSNKELTSVRIQNFRRMEKRRVAVKLGVTYDTPHKKLEAIPGFIEEIVNKVDLVEFDRCFFTEYADSSLIFEVVAFVSSKEIKDYLESMQEINLAIYKKFEQEKIEFAYPTQTIYVNK
jgi:small-conductance mechanosensitive channel